MIGYVTLGTNDMAKSAAYYDQLLGDIGATRMMEQDRFIAWGTSPQAPMLCVIHPFDEKPATVGNGVMVSFFLDSTAKVDAMHKQAMALGSKDEGAPGPRGEGGFYGAYFRDLDGNKLCAFNMPTGS